MTHPEEVAPFMVRDFDLLDESGTVLHEVRGNHSGWFEWRPEQPIQVAKLVLRVLATHGTPAAVFRVRAFGS